jgi:DegV family protein with EDD domain
MSRIAVITDTASSLPREVAARHGIGLVPVLVHFGEETLRCGIDIGDADVFARVDREGRLPTTSAPSPGDFMQAFEAAFAQGAEGVVCICLSAAISASYSAARLAAEALEGRPIRVLDSRTLSMEQGYMALAAAEAAQAGADLDEVAAQAEAMGRRCSLYAALATLKYLAMSGRVGHLAAGMASLLGIKPILAVRDAKLALLEKVRTQRRAWERVLELTALALGDAAPERVAIIHVAVPEDAQAFEALLRARIPCPDEIMTVELGAGLSVHSGAGLVGVTVVRGA